MAITFLANPVDITAWSADWADNDVSAYAPAGATGVLLHVVNNNGTDANFTIRPKGSTSNDGTALKMGLQSCHGWGFCGVDSNRIFQYKNAASPVTGCAYYLVGYTTSAFVFFLNPVTVTMPAGSGNWFDVDVSANVPAGAVAAIITYRNILTNGGIRAKGSTDDRRTNKVAKPYHFPIGLDANRVFQVYKGAETDAVYLHGYVVGGYTTIQNARNDSLGSTGGYVDLTALPAGGKAGVYEVIDTLNRTYAFRKNGSSEDLYFGDNYSSYAVCEADANGIVEGKISNTATDYYLMGYFTGYSPGGAKRRSTLGVGL